MMDRAEAYARRAVNSTRGASLVEAEAAIAHLFRVAMMEAASEGQPVRAAAAPSGLPAPPSPEVTTTGDLKRGDVVTPRWIARVSGLSKTLAYHRLKGAIALGQATKIRPGYYRLDCDGAGIRAICRPLYDRVTDVA